MMGGGRTGLISGTAILIVAFTREMMDPATLRPLVAAGIDLISANSAADGPGSDGHPWTERAHYEDIGVRVWQCDASPGLPKRFRAICEAPFAASAVLDQIRAYGSRAVSWAHNIEESCIAPLGDPIDGMQLLLQYSVTRAMFGVSSRDFITAMAEMPLPGGGWVRGGIGLEEHPSHPPRKGAVRGINYASGWHITPVGPGRSRVVYVAHSDPRGWLTHWVVATAMAGTFRAFFEGMLGELRRLGASGAAGGSDNAPTA